MGSQRHLKSPSLGRTQFGIVDQPRGPFNADSRCRSRLPQRSRDAWFRSVAGAIKATHPDFQYQPIAEPEELGNGGRVKWVAGRPGEAPAYAGTDFIIARDGRIAAVYLFFDKLP